MISNDDVQYLKGLVLSDNLFWYPSDKVCRKVMTINDMMNEPGPLAYFTNSDYINLWNCELDEFVILKKLR